MCLLCFMYMLMSTACRYACMYFCVCCVVGRGVFCWGAMFSSCYMWTPLLQAVILRDMMKLEFKIVILILSMLWLMCEAELGDFALCGFCCLSGPSCWSLNACSGATFLPIGHCLELFDPMAQGRKTPKPSQGGNITQALLSIFGHVMTRRCGTDMDKVPESRWEYCNDPQGHYRASRRRLRDPDSSKRRSHELYDCISCSKRSGKSRSRK